MHKPCKRDAKDAKRRSVLQNERLRKHIGSVRPPLRRLNFWPPRRGTRSRFLAASESLLDHS